MPRNGSARIVRIAESNEVDDWITDKPRTAEETKRLKSFGLNVHTAHDGKRIDPALRS